MTNTNYNYSHPFTGHVMVPVTVSPEGRIPPIESRVANYLPTLALTNGVSQDDLVMGPGCIVSIDQRGNIVPAALGELMQGASSTVIFTYTTADVGKVMNPQTGAILVADDLSSGVKTITKSQLATLDFMGNRGERFSVGNPVGYVDQPVFRSALRDSRPGTSTNGSNLIQMNYQRQSEIAVITAGLLRYPYMPARLASAESLTVAAISGGVRRATLANAPIARSNLNGHQLEFGGANASLYVREVENLADLASEGDFHLNADTGVLTLKTTDASALTVTLTYSHFGADSGIATNHIFPVATGGLRAGDHVTIDTQGRIVKWDAAQFSVGTTNGADQTAALFRASAMRLGKVIDTLSNSNRTSEDKVLTVGSTPVFGTVTPGSPSNVALGSHDRLRGSGTGGALESNIQAGAADRTVLVYVDFRH